MPELTRRRLLAGIPAVGATAGIAAMVATRPAQSAGPEPVGHPGHAGSGHAAFRGGVVDHAVNGFTPEELARDFDWGKTRRLVSGQVLREWDLTAAEQEIEVAPGVRFPAWTYNQRVP